MDPIREVRGFYETTGSRQVSSFITDTIAAATQGYSWHPVKTGRSGGMVFRLTRPGAPSLYVKAVDQPLANELQAEAQRLAWLRNRVPVARLLQYVQAETRSFLLTSACEGMEAATWIERGMDPRQAATLLARALRAIHDIPIEHCPFNHELATTMATARARLESGLVDENDLDPERMNWSPDRLWAELMRTRPCEEDLVFTHGDFTLDNVLIHEGRVSGLVDVGRAGIADRYQDLALITREIGPTWGRFVFQRIWDNGGGRSQGAFLSLIG